MAGIDGSGPIRLGSNSAQIPILLAKTKPQAFDKPQQEAAKNPPPGTSTPQTAAVPASTAAAQNLQLQVILQLLYPHLLKQLGVVSNPCDDGVIFCCQECDGRLFS